MAKLAPIILGGGIAAGVPFTLGSLLRITNVTPPTAGDSIAFQRTQAATEVITVGTNSFPLATETLQVIGGLISDTGAHDNVIMGRGVTASQVANARNVVLGTLARGPNGVSATECVIIGYNINLSAAAFDNLGSFVLLAPSLTFGVTTPVGGVVIVGPNNIINNAFSGPGIGNGSTWQGAGCGMGNQQSTSAVNNWVILGRSAQANASSVSVMGDNARGNHAFAIVLGRNTISLVANSLIAGAGSGAHIDTVHFGAGDTQVGGQQVTYRHTSGSGADNAAGNVIFVAGLGTGNAATLGAIVFQTGTPGASSSTVQTAATRLEIRPPSTNGASVNFTGTSGAAAAVGTLTNAPTAGNAADWIPMLFNGNVRYVPGWA